MRLTSIHHAASAICMCFAITLTSSGQMPPPETSIDDRLGLLSDENLDFLARVDHPAPGDPQLTPEDRLRHRQITDAFGFRYGIVVPETDAETRNLLFSTFLTLSADQTAFLLADQQAFEDQRRQDLVSVLRTVSVMFDKDRRDQIRSEAGLQPRTPESQRLALVSRAHGIVHDATVRHERERTDRILSMATVLDDSQLDSFAFVAEAVRQSQTQARMDSVARGSRFDPLVTLAQYLELRPAAAPDDMNELRRALFASLMERGSKLDSAVRLGLDRTLLAGPAHDFNASEETKERYQRVRERAGQAYEAFVTSNDRLAQAITSMLREPHDRAYKKCFMQEMTGWTDQAWPMELDEAVIAIETSDAAASLASAVVEARSRADDAMSTLVQGYVRWDIERAKMMGYSPRELPAQHRRFAELYLSAQIAIEDAMLSLQLAVNNLDSPEAKFGSLERAIGRHAQSAALARAEAQAFLETSSLPWAAGQIYGSEHALTWSRPSAANR